MSNLRVVNAIVELAKLVPRAPRQEQCVACASAGATLQHDLFDSISNRKQQLTLFGSWHAVLSQFLRIQPDTKMPREEIRVSGSGRFVVETLLPKLGIADQVRPKIRRVRGPPSGEPVAAVIARGDAEIGLQDVSELIHVPGIAYVGPIPAELDRNSSYAATIATRAREPDAAKALIRLLSSRQAEPIILKAGLMLPQ